MSEKGFLDKDRCCVLLTGEAIHELGVLEIGLDQTLKEEHRTVQTLM